MFTMQAPEDFGGANIDGTSYKKGKDNLVEVHTPQHRDVLLRPPHNFADLTDYSKAAEPVVEPQAELWEKYPNIYAHFAAQGVMFQDTAAESVLLAALEENLAKPAQPAQGDNGQSNETPTQSVKRQLDELGVGYASNATLAVLKNILDDKLAEIAAQTPKE